MFKTRLLVSAATVACLAPGLGTIATAAEAADLELKRVMLSTGGVGYFEYQATVSGDAELQLTVRLDQVDDVMKSLVVFDDKGRIGEVSLPGRQPLQDAFRELPFGPEALESPAALLNSLRGAEVTVTGARTLTGRILSVTSEDLILPNGGGTVARTRVSLMTGTGVAQFILEDAESLVFTDPALQGSVDKALSALAAQGGRDSRVLTLSAPSAQGDSGERTITVAYVVEAPLWKTSYRLTLPDEAGASAALQGWAVLENMSGEDWNNVELTLVSGNPVTFRQALYDTYYVDRASVPVEVVGRVLPPVDEQASLRSRKAAGSGEYEQDNAGDSYYAESAAAAPAPIASEPAGIIAAEATEAATQVIFRMPEPVTVQHGHSLLVPFVDRSLPASRIDYYLPSVQPDHPLASVLLSNDGDSGLPPGVVTLYEHDANGQVAYVGDARLGALPAGERRLISYAVDQKVSVRQTNSDTQTLTEVKIAGGVMTMTLRERYDVIFEVQGAAREARSVLLEQPRWSGWVLTEPAEKDIETTPDSYRALVTLAPGEKKNFSFVLERPIAQSIALSDLDSSTLAYYLDAQEFPAAVEAALRELAALQQAKAAHEQELQDINAAVDRIMVDQQRIRQNLVSVPAESDLQRRYLEELNKQEDELVRLRQAGDDTRAAIAAAEKAVADYIGSLNI